MRKSEGTRIWRCPRCKVGMWPDEKKHHICGTAKLARSLHRGKGPGQRVDRQIQGTVNLAYMRGYQAGFQDRVMGREPKFYACTSRKDVRKNEG